MYSVVALPSLSASLYASLRSSEEATPVTSFISSVLAISSPDTVTDDVLFLSYLSVLVIVSTFFPVSVSFSRVTPETSESVS